MRPFKPLCVAALFSLAAHAADIQNSQVRISFACGTGCLWEYSGYRFAPPVFPIDGEQVSATVGHFTEVGTPTSLANGATEYIFSGALTQDPHLRLRVQF